LNTAAGASPVGRAWPPVEYEVGREKIREYAAVTGEESAFYYHAEQAQGAGFRNVVAPPMFCAVYCAPAIAKAVFDPELGIDRGRFVHGEQSFEWFEPVCAGDLVTTNCELAEIFAKRDNAFYVFTSTSHNQRGEETMRARYTGIVRGGANAVDGPRSAAGSGGEMQRQEETIEPPDGLVEGTVLPDFKLTPDRYVPQRYAGASGDFTPIHLDAEFARSVGLPGIILHGLYTMAIVARAQIAAVGDDPRMLRSLRLQFRGVALPESEITVKSTVREIADGTAIVQTHAVQGDIEVVRDGVAQLARPVS
jgi:acyl dehydratase